MEKIDLHIHSNLSDGKLSPKQIIDEAIRNNVKIISITDHDTTDAHTKDLYDYAKTNNIELISGVEISTKINKTGIHILGYNFDLNNQIFKSKLEKIRNARHDYLHNVAKKLSDLGYVINIKELDKIEAVTKAHISLDIISNKQNEKKLLEQFGHIPNKGEFIETIMNEGCPAYVKKETITPKEASELIKSANGIVVLAHPVAYIHEDNLNEEDILKLTQDIKADGIEANYIYYDKNNNRIDEVQKWNQFAINNNLKIITIGSDFHNKDNIHPEIGFINEEKKFNINIDSLKVLLETSKK